MDPFSILAPVQAVVDNTISQDFAAGQTAAQVRSLQDFHSEGHGVDSLLRSTIDNASLSSHRRIYRQLSRQHKLSGQDIKLARRASNTRELSRAVLEFSEMDSLQQQDHQHPSKSRIRARSNVVVHGLVGDKPSISPKPLTRPQKRSRNDAAGSPSSNILRSEPHSTASSPYQSPAVLPCGQSSPEATLVNELPKTLSPYFRTLYKVDCTSNTPHQHHSALLFEDSPTPKHVISESEDSGESKRRFQKRALPHVDGSSPIRDLEAYMEDNVGLAFIILRHFTCSTRSLTRDEDMYITSSELRSALHAVAQCYISEPGRPSDDPQEPFDALNSEQILHAPYLFLYYHRDLLRQFSASKPAAATSVNALLAYTGEKYGKSYAAADSLFERGVVTTGHESMLYAPNDIVVGLETDSREPVAYVVERWATPMNNSMLKLCCWNWQMDGVGFARRSRELTLPQVPESVELDIGKLVVVPYRFVSSDLSLRLRLRGQKHWNLRKQSYVSYQGWNVSRDQYYTDSRFMIDHRTFHRMHPGSEAFRFKKTDQLPFDPRPPYLSVDAADDHNISLLLPADTHGFYFTEKKWLNIFVDSIDAVAWNKRAFDRLVLPSETKELVKALVTVRTSQRGVKRGLGLAGKRDDIIASKGNGLIMLLHGGPGTGKSLTAESVAEVAEMPLYRVTCGDVGTSADVVERYLNNVLTLGKEWNCVLLLDEADIFLEERSMSDLKRNSLVSVFLRVLEYYDGILMLTTNRIGTFDEAFKSRVQVALYYKPLTRASRKKIWQNFIEMMEEDQENADFEELREHLDELAGHELNGRQIRNTITTARQLAIYKKEQLEWSHVKYALSLSTEFNEYLKRVQGHTDAQWAQEEGIR